MAERRDIAKSVLLSILTCGLYLLYWMVQVNDGIMDLNNDDGPSGFTVILLNILTCGIYGVYWSYRSGRRMANAQEKYGVRVNDNSVLYTIISLFIGNLIVVAIIQSDMNEILDFIEYKDNKKSSDFFNTDASYESITSEERKLEDEDEEY